MDSTQDGLSSRGELSQERHNQVGALTIQTRSRLIEEEEGTDVRQSSREFIDLRLADQFNTDSQTLSLFYTETSTRSTNQGVLDIVQFQKINDDIDIGQLFLNISFRSESDVLRAHLVRERSGLSKQSREFQSFSNCSLWQVNINLFAITGSTLEGNWELFAVHQHFSLDLSVGFSSSKDIHQGRLACTGRTHESGKCTSFAVTEDIVKKDFGLTIGLNSVSEILPSKDTVVSISKIKKTYVLTAWTSSGTSSSRLFDRFGFSLLGFSLT